MICASCFASVVRSSSRFGRAFFALAVDRTVLRPSAWGARANAPAETVAHQLARASENFSAASADQMQETIRRLRKGKPPRALLSLLPNRRLDRLKQRQASATPTASRGSPAATPSFSITSSQPHRARFRPHPNMFQQTDPAAADRHRPAIHRNRLLCPRRALSAAY